MTEFAQNGTGTLPVSIPSEHGLLHGELASIPDAPGTVVLVHAAMALDAKDRAVAHELRKAGLSTMTVNLLSHQEEHFPDVYNNVPLLSKRLVDFLGVLKNRILMGEMPQQPIGLFAANITSPVVIRVAALRNHDIAAIVCRDGLIDLAGVLYLRVLESPLLLLAEENDTQHLASNHRALQEVSCRKELITVPEIGVDYALSEGFEICLREATRWFIDNFDHAGQSP